MFAIDTERSPERDGKLQVIACIEDSQFIRRIPGHTRQGDAMAGVAARGPPANDGAAFILDGAAGNARQYPDKKITKYASTGNKSHGTGPVAV